MARLWREIDIPPLWLGLFAALVWIQSVAAPLPVLGEAGRLPGGVLIAAGMMLMAVAAATMALARTTVIPRRDPASLVTSGVFAVSRNPIYLADTLILAGFVLFRDALPSLVLLPLFVQLITRRYILGEEARLRSGFGAAFETYARRTRRWI